MEENNVQLETILDEFNLALNNKDKLRAYISLGYLEIARDPKFELHCAQVLSMDGEYYLSNRMLSKYTYDTDRSADDYYLTKKEEEGFPIEMENLALSGQLTRVMIIHYGTHKAHVDLFHRLYCIQLAYDKASDDELDNWLKIDKLHAKNSPRVIDSTNSSKSNEYKILFFQHFCMDIVHFVNFRKKENEIKTIYSTIERNNIDKNNLQRLINLITLYPVFNEKGELLMKSLICIDIKEFSNFRTIEWVDEIISNILFKLCNSRCEALSNYIVYFKVLEELGLHIKYYNCAKKYMNKLMSFPKVYKDDVHHIIGNAYYIGKKEKLETDNNLVKYIEDNRNLFKEEEDYIDNKKIYDILSIEGKSAYEIAEWEFNNSQTSYFGWKDAGPLSLSFFRIIELEINKKFIIKLIKECGYQQLKDRYDKDINNENLSLKRKKNYIYTWERNLKSFEKICKNDNKINGLELGALKVFIDAINTYEQTNIGELLSTNCKKIMTKEGYKALFNGEFVNIISDENRSKFRNPPAHTRFLPYSIAVECRTFVKKSILKFGEWFIYR